MTTTFLDVEGAAQFLLVKPATIYAWVYQRRIPFRKHGRRVVFDRQDLERWSQSQAVRPEGEIYDRSTPTHAL